MGEKEKHFVFEDVSVLCLLWVFERISVLQICLEAEALRSAGSLAESAKGASSKLLEVD